MKKIITVIITISLLMSIQAVVYAENENENYQTGLLWDEWDEMIEFATIPDSVLVLSKMSILRKGDLDGDGQITASDARKCLRAAASLEFLSDVQKIAADVTGPNSITSADARKILRIAAGLDKQVSNIIEMPTGWGFIFGSLKTAGSGMYRWYCTADDELSVIQTERDYSPGCVIGAPVDSFFLFSAEKEGTYTAHFELKASWENEPIDEFDVIIVVK